MTGKILFASTSDAKRGPLAFIIMRDLVAVSGLEGRVRIDAAGLPGRVDGKVPRVIVKQVRNLLGFHQALTLQKYRPRVITEKLLKRQDLVITMDDEARSVVAGMVEALHPVVRPRVKDRSDYGMAELPDPEEGRGSWSEMITKMREELEYHFRIILKDSGM
jgi:protein-tyrosine-phosphatase